MAINILATKKKYLLFPEKIFVAFSICFGLLFIFITPPFQVPDEYLHFNYAYAVSQGHLYGSVTDIPKTMQQLGDLTRTLPSHPEVKIPYARLMQFIGIPLHPEDKVTVAYNATAKYSPIPYFPSAISIFIARVLNFNPFDLFYFGRIVNLVCWILLGYIALKLMPDYKWTYLILLLTPMSLFEAASYSADAFLNAISFVWIGLCLHYSFSKNEEVFAIRSKAQIIVIASLLSLTKPPYIFLLGLFFLIPKRKYGPSKLYKKNIVVFFGICLVLFIISLLYLLNDGSVTSEWSNYSIAGQLVFLFANPVQLPIIILRSIKQLIIPYWYSSIGLLGWLDTLLPSYIYVTYPIVALLSCLIDQKKEAEFCFKKKLLIMFSGFAVLFTVFLSLYLTWSPVGNKIVDGFQGRYLIPLFLLMPTLFVNKLTPVSKNWKGWVVSGYIFIVLGLACRALILRYYVA